MLRGKSSFALFNLSLQLLNGPLVGRNIPIALSFNHLHEMVQNSLIEVLASQMGITICSNHFENTIVDRQNRHVECSSSQVKHQNVLLFLLVQPISDGGGCRLVQHSDDVESSDNSGILS